MPKPTNAHGQFERSEEFGRAVNFGDTLVAATSTQVRDGNRRRKRVTIVNTGATRIDASLGSTAASAVGIPIFPQGVMTVESDALGYLWVGPIALISTGTPTYSGTEES